MVTISGRSKARTSAVNVVLPSASIQQQPCSCASQTALLRKISSLALCRTPAPPPRPPARREACPASKPNTPVTRLYGQWCFAPGNLQTMDLYCCYTSLRPLFLVKWINHSSCWLNKPNRQMFTTRRTINYTEAHTLLPQS